MRKLSLYVLLLPLVLSCEDVIDVDVPNTPPRLIVDALVRVDTSLPTTIVRIKATTSTSFFETPQPAVLDRLQLQDEVSGNAFFPTETISGSGVYEVPLSSAGFDTGGRWILSFTHEDQLYLSFAQFIPTVPLDNVQQGTETLFDETDTEIIVSFTDDGSQEDFYVFDFGFGEYLTVEDEFFNGQPFEFSFFIDAQVIPGQTVNVSILGADKSFFDYVSQLIVQANSGDQGPFQTPAATVRGNIFNVTDIDNIDFFNNVAQPDNFVLGYFAIVQSFTRSVTIE
ncbi:DUF4249 family protein [Arenibacter sp. GZD96]|uniref:DUF4249 family protein n=1 Tax=Aurantibrevibacter litoralis TaxID=3106030 RepID=UPI002B00093C|nr:DUF4249 family protein [Arenibacter sp. GZD-96]MEA1786951.1 DUF4249 family protein [Arenibacter sp. GZD-96]